jgi:hypothetical protein
MRSKIILALTLALIGVAQAQQTTYTYSGQVMSGSGPYVLAGYVTLAQPLAANGVQIVTPVNYFIAGNEPLQMTNVGGPPLVAPGNNPFSFSFTTTNGVITAWDIEIPTSSGNSIAQASITQLGDSYSLTTAEPDCPVIPSRCVEPIIASNTTPGIWIVPPAPVACAAPPAAAPVPAPTPTPTPAPAPATAPPVATSTTTIHFRGIFEGRR